MNPIAEPDTRQEIVVIGGLANWMLAELRAQYRVHDLAATTDRAALLAQAAHVSAAVTTGAVGIDADTVRQLPRLGMLACFGVGYDKVDRVALGQTELDQGLFIRDIGLDGVPDLVSDRLHQLLVGVDGQHVMADPRQFAGSSTAETT